MAHKNIDSNSRTGSLTGKSSPSPGMLISVTMRKLFCERDRGHFRNKNSIKNLLATKQFNAHRRQDDIDTKSLTISHRSILHAAACGAVGCVPLRREQAGKQCS